MDKRMSCVSIAVLMRDKNLELVQDVGHAPPPEPAADACVRRCLPESVRCGVESNEVLDGEDDDAGRVDAEQLNVELFAAAQRSTFGRRRIVDAARYSLNDVSQHRRGDEETSDVVEDERPGAVLRVFEPSPETASQRRRFGDCVFMAGCQLLLRLPRYCQSVC